MTVLPQVSSDLDTALVEIARTLPDLPTVVRYHDDFEDKLRTLRDLAGAASVPIELDGRRQFIHFDTFGTAAPVLKHVIVDWIGRLDPHTVSMAATSLSLYVRDHGLHSLYTLISVPVFEARAHWDLFARIKATPPQATALRALLHSLCNLSIGYWNPRCAPLVRSLKSPRVDKHRVIRTGDCFLPLDHQAQIVDYIDEVCARVAQSPGTVTDTDLRDACILVIAFQYAFRPGQIARIEIADVRIFDTGAVHIAVVAAKQQDKRKRSRVTRRIKREWAPLFIEFLRRRSSDDFPSNPKAPAHLLFRQTPAEISQVLIGLTEAVTGEAWTATDLRHTAAQRLADAGVAHISLSEFMVHASYRTANVYFDTSPTQAQRVNQALAVSPIYANVAQVARTRTIDKEMLLRLPEDRQIGGVPHGIPIAGIGGCDLGQSLCTKNPVLSCYTCRRFMPVSEPDIHEQVLDQLRPVVLEFANASRNNEQSPAFIQLRSTLDGVRRVVEGLKAERGTE